jgi:hypothetical protein
MTPNHLGLQRGRTMRRHHIPEDSIHHRSRRENGKYYIVGPYGRLIITFDESTAAKLYLYGNTDTSMELPLQVALFPDRREVHYRCKTKGTDVRFEVFTAVTMKKGCLLGCYALWLL